MNIRTIYQDNDQRTSITVPAYLRDKFNLKKGSTVNVTDNGKSIVITPIREQ